MGRVKGGHLSSLGHDGLLVFGREEEMGHSLLFGGREVGWVMGGRHGWGHWGIFFGFHFSLRSEYFGTSKMRNFHIKLFIYIFS